MIGALLFLLVFMALYAIMVAYLEHEGFGRWITVPLDILGVVITAAFLMMIFH